MESTNFDNIIEDNKDEMLDFLRDLVACELPSSDAVTGKNGQDLVSGLLSKLGFSVTKNYPVEPDAEDKLNYASRWSVVGTLKGHANGPSLALNSHADVVGLGDVSKWKYPPRECTLENGKVYGRGVIDARGCLTTFLFALKAIIESGTQLDGDIIFQSVADEEILGKGTEALVNQGYTADAVLVGEPTKLTFCPATRGAAQFFLDVKGHAAHSGVSYEGQNAILKTMPYIDALVKLQYELDEKYMHTLWKDYPIAHVVNIALINGGESPSRVPSTCTVSGLVGCIAGETLKDIHKWVEDVVTKVTERDPWLKENPPTLRWAETMQFEPSASVLDERFFEIAEACSNEVLGKYETPKAFTAVSDLRYFLNNTSSVGANFGPGDIKQAHAYDESVDFKDIIKACKVAARFIYNWTSSESK